MMSFGYLRSPFDDLSPVWRHDFHSPWTYSPGFCSVYGPTGFCDGHRRKPRARNAREPNAEVPHYFEVPLRRKVKSTRENTACKPEELEEQQLEKAEVPNYLEAPLARKVNSGREQPNTACKPEELPSENEEDYEENVLESGEKDEDPGAQMKTLELSANDADTETPQNTEGSFEPAVETPRESEDTDEAEVGEKIEVIQGQLSKARELVPRLEAFSGNAKERLYLEEHLTRCILELDKVEANGSDVVKSNRKAAIKEIESLLSDLDGR